MRGTPEAALTGLGTGRCSGCSHDAMQRLTELHSPPPAPRQAFLDQAQASIPWPPPSPSKIWPRCEWGARP